MSTTTNTPETNNNVQGQAPINPVPVNTETVNTAPVNTAPNPVADAINEDYPGFELDAIHADLKVIDEVENILDLKEEQYPKFTLAKNKARFLRMLTWYKNKETWLDVAPLSGVSKTFKQQSKELEGIRANKLDYEMELETGTLTPSQRSYRCDELKMCKVHEKMAVHLISKMQLKIKSGRR